MLIREGSNFPEELEALYNAAIATEGVTTSDGDAFGMTLIDSRLIGSGANSFVNWAAQIWPGRYDVTDVRPIAAFDNATGAITVEAPFKQGQIPTNTPYQIVMLGGGGGGGAPPPTSPSIGLWMFGVCDPGMAASATTIQCSNLAGFESDIFNDEFWMQVIHNNNSVGNPPEGEIRRITDYNGATGVFTVDSFTVNVEANDLLCIFHESIMSIEILGTGTLDASSATVPADSTRTEGNDYFNGDWLICTEGAVRFQPRLIIDYIGATGVFTIDPNNPFTAATGLVDYIVVKGQANYNWPYVKADLSIMDAPQVDQDSIEVTRLSLSNLRPDDAVIPVGEFSGSTIDIDRYRIGTDVSWNNIVAAQAMTEAAGYAYYDYTVPSASWQDGDLMRIRTSACVVEIPAGGGQQFFVPAMSKWTVVGGLSAIIKKLKTLQKVFWMADYDEFDVAAASPVSIPRWIGEVFTGAAEASNADINTTTAGQAYVIADPDATPVGTGYQLRHRPARKSKHFAAIVDANYTWGTVGAALDGGLMVSAGSSYDLLNNLYIVRRRTSVPANEIRVTGTLDGVDVSPVTAAVTDDAVAFMIERSGDVWRFYYSLVGSPNYEWTLVTQVHDTDNDMTATTNISLRAYSVGGADAESVQVDFDNFKYYTNFGYMESILGNQLDTPAGPGVEQTAHAAIRGIMQALGVVAAAGAQFEVDGSPDLWDALVADSSANASITTTTGDRDAAVIQRLAAIINAINITDAATLTGFEEDGSGATLFDLLAAIQGEADAGSDADTLVDAQLNQADNTWIGATLLMLSGNNAGLARPIIDSALATTSVELRPAFPNAIAISDAYAILTRHEPPVAPTDGTEDYLPRDVIGAKADTIPAMNLAPSATDSLVRHIKAILERVGATPADLDDSVLTILGQRDDAVPAMTAAPAATDTVVERLGAILERIGVTPADPDDALLTTVGQRDDAVTVAATASLVSLLRNVHAALSIVAAGAGGGFEIDGAPDLWDALVVDSSSDANIISLTGNRDGAIIERLSAIINALNITNAASGVGFEEDGTSNLVTALGTDGVTVTDSAVSVLGAVGANNANNAFASNLVVENGDGSVLERLEELRGTTSTATHNIEIAHGTAVQTVADLSPIRHGMIAIQFDLNTLVVAVEGGTVIVRLQNMIDGVTLRTIDRAEFLVGTDEVHPTVSGYIQEGTTTARVTIQVNSAVTAQRAIPYRIVEAA